MALRGITTDTQLAIIAAGMGGGSGTGAAGHIARLAKEQGAMTIAVVTYPFKSEGATRKENAEWGLERLREHCDTILVIPNERLLEIEGVKDLPLASAFRVGDELLVRSIIGVTELLTRDGMVNLDFEDLKAVIHSGAGVAMIGLGAGSGPGRAEEATLEALHSPLLDLDFSDARGALINVVGGNNLTLGEAERCAQIITERISPHAKSSGEPLLMKHWMMKSASCWCLQVSRVSKFMAPRNVVNSKHYGAVQLNLSIDQSRM